MANRADTFNRADNATSLGTPSDGGSAWVEGFGSGAWGVAGNKAAESAGLTNAIVYLESGLADCDVQCTFSTIASSRTGIIFRYADANNNWIVFVYGDASLMRLYLSSGGFMSSLEDSYSGTVSDGDVIKASCSGNTITVYQNGVQRMTATNAANNSATKHGLISLGFSTPRLDDFSVTGGSPPPPPGVFAGAVYHHMLAGGNAA